MAGEAPTTLFTDIFVVSRLNPEGKKFAKGVYCTAPTGSFLAVSEGLDRRRHTANCMVVCAMLSSPAILYDFNFVFMLFVGRSVNRLICRAQTFEADLSIDVASEFFPVSEGEQFWVALARTLRLDGAPEDDTYDQSGKETLLDQYDYAMHGKVFRYEHVSANHVCVLRFVLHHTCLASLFRSTSLGGCVCDLRQGHSRFVRRPSDAASRRASPFHTLGNGLSYLLSVEKGKQDMRARICGNGAQVPFVTQLTCPSCSTCWGLSLNHTITGTQRTQRQPHTVHARREEMLEREGLVRLQSRRMAQRC